MDQKLSDVLFKPITDEYNTQYIPAKGSEERIERFLSSKSKEDATVKVLVAVSVLITLVNIALVAYITLRK